MYYLVSVIACSSTANATIMDNKESSRLSHTAAATVFVRVVPPPHPKPVSRGRGGRVVAAPRNYFILCISKGKKETIAIDFFLTSGGKIEVFYSSER